MLAVRGVWLTRLMSAIETLAAALHAACLCDLPDIEWDEVDSAAERAYLDARSAAERSAYFETKRKAEDVGLFSRERGVPVIRKTRRPWPNACEVTMFQQSWPNTARGYDINGGVAGQAFTKAYTVVVQCCHTGYAAVYFGSGKLAYLVSPEKQNEAWRSALAKQCLPSQRDAQKWGILA